MKTIHPAVAEHVIEENCRLREALRRIADLPIDPCSTENDYRLSGAKAIAEGALSQQAEPCEHSDHVRPSDRICIECGERVPQAEPARALDERQPTAVPEGWLIELGFDVLDRPFRFVDSKSHTPTIKVILPPCEPDDSSSWDLRDEIARRIGSVLAAPIAQTAPKIAAKMPCGTAVTNVYEAYEAGKRAAAPQPEQSGLLEAAKAFADAARKNIYPCPDKPNSLSGKLQALDRAIAAALSAQGDKP